MALTHDGSGGWRHDHNGSPAGILTKLERLRIRLSSIPGRKYVSSQAEIVPELSRLAAGMAIPIPSEDEVQLMAEKTEKWGLDRGIQFDPRDWARSCQLTPLSFSVMPKRVTT
jgi:hypothetical protein